MKFIVVKTLMILSICALMALMAVNGRQLASACGVCEIFWDAPPDPTCDTTDGSGGYGYTLHTRGSSSGHDQWTLLQKISTPSGNNVKNVSANPSSTTITEIGGIAEFNVTTVCTGTLSDGTKNGFSDLNAWDATCFACSGAHRVTVMKDGASCP